MDKETSVVVTGGSRGIGLAISRHLAARAHVVTLDPAAAPDPGHPRVHALAGDASDPGDASAAARLAESQAPLTGWVNSAAVFNDADLGTAGADEISTLIMLNLTPAVVGCSTAVRHFLAHKRHGAIVNISSHQAQRPVRGALPYATAKAAVEGLTRAAAVDHGPDGIRVNALALGSISTERFEEYRRIHPGTDALMAALHPLGHVGAALDVARAVSFMLSPESAFITGAVLPVDGGRSALGPDPEAL